jgi:glycosyltransferase involved in cell wall biosynthesis
VDKDPVRILMLHNSYRESGGEDQAVDQERRLLATRGHEVYLYSLSNNEIKGIPKTVRTGLTACYSWRTKLHVKKVLGNFHPDIVHIHNFFPLLTPSIYDACIEAGIPIVQSLHNYRIICANALFYRNGGACEDCLLHAPCKAILHRCYRNSILGTAVVVGMIAVHRHLRTWSKKVNRFIALSVFSKEKFVRFGIPPDRIAIKPNFVNSLPNQKIGNGHRSGALFVGRLSEEKGITKLLQAWKGFSERLTIVGDGPLAAFVSRRQNGSSIRWLGYLTRDKLFAAIQTARFVITPSQCYENFPLIIAEAFAAGTPVIAARIGALPEAVIDGRTGLLYNTCDNKALIRRIKWAFDHPDEMALMGRRARKQFDRCYAPEVTYSQLMQVYRAAMEEGSPR